MGTFVLHTDRMKITFLCIIAVLFCTFSCAMPVQEIDSEGENGVEMEDYRKATSKKASKVRSRSRKPTHGSISEAEKQRIFVKQCTNRRGYKTNGSCKEFLEKSLLNSYPVNTYLLSVCFEKEWFYRENRELCDSLLTFF